MHWHIHKKNIPLFCECYELHCWWCFVRVLLLLILFSFCVAVSANCEWRVSKLARTHLQTNKWCPLHHWTANYFLFFSRSTYVMLHTTLHMYPNQNQTTHTLENLHPKPTHYPLETQRKCTFNFEYNRDAHGDFHTSKGGSTFLVSIWIRHWLGSVRFGSVGLLGRWRTCALACSFENAHIRYFRRIRVFAFFCRVEVGSDEMIPVSGKVWIGQVHLCDSQKAIKFRGARRGHNSKDLIHSAK